MRIIVAEFQKSGGSWLTSMLADALGVPARDLYVDNNFKAFDLKNHPWYRHSSLWNLTENCIIKSHEFADTALHSFDANVLHLIRDGRDVVVSKYFFERDFCVNNNIISSFDITFEEFIEKNSKEWSKYVIGWHNTDAMQITYEEILSDPFAAINRILQKLTLPVNNDLIINAIKANTKDNFSKKLEDTFEHNTFVRKGISGDWKNHFTEEHKRIFKECAGNTLITMGYEKNFEW